MAGSLPCHKVKHAGQQSLPLCILILSNLFMAIFLHGSRQPMTTRPVKNASNMKKKYKMWQRKQCDISQNRT